MKKFHNGLGDEQIIKKIDKIKSHARLVFELILIGFLLFYACYYYSIDERLERGQENLNAAEHKYVKDVCAHGRLQRKNGDDGRENINYCAEKTPEEIVYINEDILNAFKN